MRMFERTERTALMPSSPSLRDGLRSLMASAAGRRDVSGAASASGGGSRCVLTK